MGFVVLVILGGAALQRCGICLFSTGAKLEDVTRRVASKRRAHYAGFLFFESPHQ